MKFNFFSKSVKIEKLQVDYHTHLLPGVDDGVKSIDEMLYLIDEMVRYGIKEFCFTPHCYHPIYQNTLSKLEPIYNKLLPLLGERFPGIKFNLAGEIRLSSDLYDAVMQGVQLPEIKENTLLLEASLIETSSIFESLQFLLQSKGYRLVLAHPERYPYMSNNFSNYQKLRDAGWEFQVNQLSLMGGYGNNIQKIAIKLLNKGWVDYFGSDIHRREHLRYLK